MFYVYIHLRLDTGEIFYVGKGQKKRAYDHRGRNPHWKAIVAKHGRSVHIDTVWENEDEAFAREIHLISKFRRSGINMVNLTDGGEGPSGHTHSAEQRARIGASLKGRTHSLESRLKMSQTLKGHTVSPESRAKTGAANRGRIHSLETRERISASLKGRIVSSETRSKLSAANMGLVRSPETRARMLAAWEVRRTNPKLQRTI